MENWMRLIQTQTCWKHKRSQVEYLGMTLDIASPRGRNWNGKLNTVWIGWQGGIPILSVYNKLHVQSGFMGYSFGVVPLDKCWDFSKVSDVKSRGTWSMHLHLSGMLTSNVESVNNENRNLFKNISNISSSRRQHSGLTTGLDCGAKTEYNSRERCVSFDMSIYILGFSN